MTRRLSRNGTRRWFPVLFLIASTIAHAVGADFPGVSLVRTQGVVNFRAAVATNWVPARLDQRLFVQDRIRTLTNSRAAVKLAELDVVQVNERTIFQVLPPRNAGAKARIDFEQGRMYFLDRNGRHQLEIDTPTAEAGVEGTEFHLEVRPDGGTVLTLFDGRVTLTNTLGGVILDPGDQGIVDPGQAPRKTAVLDAISIIQWCLYYPAVLDPAELDLPPGERARLDSSLAAYRSGNLLRALELFPADAPPQTPDGVTYHAGLLLAVGKAAEAAALLENRGPGNAAARALRTLIAAVQLRPPPDPAEPSTASEWLAHSYYEQSRFRLTTALHAAREAVRRSPEFGFGWARVADLEFSFGRLGAMQEALDRALEFTPENAQAHALQGFVHAGANRLDRAEAAFEEAIRLDSALGNAWLGRGLCRIKRGETQNGRNDLQIAAALEPNRSLLRSYLGKAFANEYDFRRALAELRLAITNDPADPTPWLYSGLLRQQQYQFNSGIRDLEHSATLNTNRQVYRSRLLLDQDRAVRSARLAPMYREAGLTEVSLREATQAVAGDYANYSAHLFLADSIDALRDPTRFNLRHETVWFNELLLANLLAPVGGGTLSPYVSQQEYSRLLERDRVGLSSSSEYWSDGRFRQIASQFGTWRNTSWSFDVEYQHNDGTRPNNDLDRLEWYSTVKQQLGPRDSVMLLAKYQDFESGDNFQYTDPGDARPAYRFEDDQHPLIVAGFHHEWQPGIHTLFLGGHLANDPRFSDRQAPQLLLEWYSPDDVYDGARALPMDVAYSGSFDAATAELNQIFAVERITAVMGGRFQSGSFGATSALANPPPTDTVNFVELPETDLLEEDFERVSAYGYLTWEAFRNFLVTGGVAYERVEMPINFRAPPLSPGTETRDQLGPKAALVWTLTPAVTLRGAYSRSLGGVSFDESFRLEPTQLAGFAQSYRTLASESLTSTVAAPEFETAGAALDLKLGRATYAGLTAERLSSEVDRTIGVFVQDTFFAAPDARNIAPGATAEALSYTEESVRGDIHRLFGDCWSMGLRASFTRAELETNFPLLPPDLGLNRANESELLRAGGYTVFNHPSGWFLRGDVDWYHQRNFGYAAASAESAGEEFPQVNLYVGYRFPHQRAELLLGALNVTDEDYRLNPLTPYYELPRERVFYLRFRFNF